MRLMMLKISPRAAPARGDGARFCGGGGRRGVGVAVGRSCAEGGIFDAAASDDDDADFDAEEERGGDEEE